MAHIGKKNTTVDENLKFGRRKKTANLFRDGSPDKE